MAAEAQRGNRGSAEGDIVKMAAEAQSSKILTREDLNSITNRVIGLAIEVHRTLGPGFVEKIYEKALQYEFERNRLKFSNQKVIYVSYKDLELGEQRVDFLIDDEIIVELKAVAALNETHIAQMLSYLKTLNKRVGLILNFAQLTLDIKRVVNKF